MNFLQLNLNNFQIFDENKLFLVIIKLLTFRNINILNVFELKLISYKKLYFLQF